MPRQEPLVLHVLNGASQQQRVEWDREKPLVIGRDPACDLVTADDHISARHAELRADQGRVFAVDCGSTNGTRLVRGGELRPLDSQGVEVLPGDTLSIGDAEHPVVVAAYWTAAEEADADHARVVATTHLHRLGDFEKRVSANPSALRLVYDGLKRLNRNLDFASVLDEGAQLAFALLPAATHVTVILERDHHAAEPNPADAQVSYVPVLCMRRDRTLETPRPISRWLRTRVLDEGAAILVDDARALDASHSLQAAAIQAVIAAPLWVGDHVTGILQVDRRQVDRRQDPRQGDPRQVDPRQVEAAGIFTEEDLERAVVVASHVGLALDHARLHQRLRASEERLRGENRFLKRRDAAPSAEMVGLSPAMRHVQALVDRVKDTNVPVCIVGETGTGKELIARAIHYGSRRADQLFVAQNCAALPADLLESELFGHKKGAFTGADADKKGLFELAHGGTIFLDEIGETAPAMQAKLLRVLQEGEVRPVGAIKTLRVDVRVISATNRNLEEEVAEGRFREDLYYRLNVFPVQLPPLRDRGGDIQLLAEHFMRVYALELGRAPLPFEPRTLDLLRQYPWPGNIRELQNEIQRVIICGTSGELVSPTDLSPRIRTVDAVLSRVADDGDMPLRDRLANVERYMLIEALRAHGNNKTRTAAALGITREGLHKKLARFGLA